MKMTTKLPVPNEPIKLMTPERKTDLAMINEEETTELQIEEDQKEPEPIISMSRIHPVAGYSDTENMWVKICNIDKEEKIGNKYQNDKSMVQIQVSDKVFKIKKNPLYKDQSRLAELLHKYVPTEVN